MVFFFRLFHYQKMEYGSRDVGLETAAASATEVLDKQGDDVSCASSSRSRSRTRRRSRRSSSCASSNSNSSSSISSEASAATTSDWPHQMSNALPSSAALLLNSLYSLHALHSGRGMLWHEAREANEHDETKQTQQDQSEVYTLKSFVISIAWSFYIFGRVLKYFTFNVEGRDERRERDADS